ncbi:MAG: glutathione reductase (NADPH) [Myxococcota bacterium]
MPSYDYDLLVLGGGSAGVRCSRIAAGLGARVVLVEDKALGGTCVNVGCVPKKLLAIGSHFAEDVEDAAGFGWTIAPPTFDWQTLVRNKDTEIARLNGIYEGMLERAGVEVVTGWGTLTDAHTVEVDGRRLHAEHIVICTGGVPWAPEFPGREHVLVSDDMFSLPRLPKRMVVAGGGYIAVEFASILHGFGVEVDLVYRGGLFLRGFDEEMRHHLANELRRKGVRLHFDCMFREVERRGPDDFLVHLTDGEHLQADTVLFAVGRRPATGGIGLDALGVRMNERGAIEVDARFQTSVPSIYALGDALDRFNLTPVALAEGTALAHQLFAGPPRTVAYDAIPTAIFCNPNMATVGLTEAKARAVHPRVRIYTSSFRSMKHTLSGRNERILMKLIVDDATDRVVGAHMVGPDAGELIQGIAVAMTCGATKAQFDSTIGIHPTAAEEFVTMRTLKRT